MIRQGAACGGAWYTSIPQFRPIATQRLTYIVTNFVVLQKASKSVNQSKISLALEVRTR
jgi:hypothetical protein